MVRDIQSPAKVIHGWQVWEISSKLALKEIIKPQIVLVIA